MSDDDDDGELVRRSETARVFAGWRHGRRARRGHVTASEEAALGVYRHPASHSAGDLLRDSSSQQGHADRHRRPARTQGQ